MDYNSKVHNRRSVRLQHYDYSQNGAYFVTICVRDKECLFGEVVDGIMVLNEFGEIVEKELKRTSEIRKNVSMISHVVMPNHIHAIIFISRGTLQRAPTFEQFGKPTSNSIPSIVRGFKSTVTKQINELRKSPCVKIWQRGYHEHIIRNEQSFEKIHDYIVRNPEMWEDDEFFMSI